MTVLRKPFEIAHHSIKPGERQLLHLGLPRLITNNPIGLPVHVLHGRREGPVLFVSAAVHGDELNGVEIIRRLLAIKSLRALHGTLLAAPMVNVYGTLNNSRYLPDRRDLNRSFPGSGRGSMASRLADTFMKEVVKQCNYGIDLHTGAINRSNLPQIRADLDDAEINELAHAFGVPVLLNAGLREGSLRAVAADRGVKVLVYEAGEALRLDEVSIRAGLHGILNVMRAIGMLKTRRRRKPSEPFVARSSSWVRAGDSGLFHARIDLGGVVKQGEHIGSVFDPVTGEEDQVLAPFRGVIIGRNVHPLVHEGEAVFHVARFGNELRDVADELESFSQEFDPDVILPTDEPPVV